MAFQLIIQKLATHLLFLPLPVAAVDLQLPPAVVDLELNPAGLIRPRAVVPPGRCPTPRHPPLEVRSRLPELFGLI